jgi:hypothetical protein
LYALIFGMLRLKLTLLVLFTVALSVEPILHNHSLIPQHGETAVSALAAGCPACTLAAARMSLRAPAVHAPTAVVYALIALPESAPAKPVRIPLASRAPPTVL